MLRAFALAGALLLGLALPGLLVQADYTVVWTNVRSGLGMSYPAVQVAWPGSPFTVHNCGHYWCSVTVAGVSGYMSARYPAQSASTTNWVNVRAGPGMSYPGVQVALPGSTFAVHRCGHYWCRVTVAESPDTCRPARCLAGRPRQGRSPSTGAAWKQPIPINTCSTTDNEFWGAVHPRVIHPKGGRTDGSGRRRRRPRPRIRSL